MMAQRQIFRRMVTARNLCNRIGTAHLSSLISNSVLRKCVIPCTHQSYEVNKVASFHNSAATWNENIFNIQDEQDFENRVMSNSVPVIVDFHASWCAPCKLLGPRIEAVTTSKGGKVVLAKVDVDQNSEIAMEHGVQAVPTVLMVKGGKIVDKFIGLKEEDEISTFVDGFIAPEA